uniref:H-2 class II histocompatibility antigen, E-S beta chain-like isoform X1 n=1 Tax=Pogona vitticeps TaxID=103695 RepID=A0ABM5FF62_9SAUR
MGSSRRALGGFLVAGMMGMVVLTAESAAEPPVHILYQVIGECYFQSNGSGAGSGPTPPPPRVRFLQRHFYDRQEFVRFDSDRGEFEAVTPLGEPIARYWNSQKERLERKRSEVDYFCRHNYGILEPLARERRVQPKVKIAPSSYDSSSHHTLLICNVDGFWPSQIEIKWFRNGKEEDEARVFTTDLIRNGDWTFQMAVMLEAQPERGDVYACQVEHASFPEPVTVRWEPQSASARSKMWTGVAGIVLGLVFLAPGLVLYLKNKKGERAIPQPPVALLH